MRLLLQHRTRYVYRQPAALGPHLVRLRPASHAKAAIETYGLAIDPPCELRWQQDPVGNHLARATWADGTRTEKLELTVELAVDIRPVNPFDFFVEESAKRFPFAYPPELSAELAPFFSRVGEPGGRGPLFERLLAELPREGDTVDLLVRINRIVKDRIRYVIRDEPGIWSPEETLGAGRGSCRDSAVLLGALLRELGFAARFVSGYLVQLTDEGMIPDEPKGVGRDVLDLHAWTEVYLPGAGWIGFDSTSGLLCGEGHIPLASAAGPSSAAPVEGTSSEIAAEISFEMVVSRLGHEPRPTLPYPEETWQGLLAAGDTADERLALLGVPLTQGGEPTFNSREHPYAPEWNDEALGPTKTTQGRRLAARLRERLAPGAAILERTGKIYPGESLPRWALELVWRTDGEPVWHADPFPGPGNVSISDARRLAEAIARRLGVGAEPREAFEDPWRFFQEEQSLPVEVDPSRADLEDPEERRRLARILERGLGSAVGWVLPLARRNGTWVSEEWRFRRGRLFLLPGDGPIGLRLPLRSLGAGYEPEPPRPEDLAGFPPDPRRLREDDEGQLRLPVPSSPVFFGAGVRTALCVEPRDGNVRVFLPPLHTAGDFLLLLREIEIAAAEAAVPVALEGYGPPPSPELRSFSVTPDPGVLEVNLPPTSRSREHADLLDRVFDAALHAGLHAERFQLDGRLAGSGGGHHLTFGGPTPLESPFLVRPQLLASLLTFLQHHPSLSYLFTGLFVGPTSQAPRVDEARHESLHELEIALDRAFAEPEGSQTRSQHFARSAFPSIVPAPGRSDSWTGLGPSGQPPPWLTDLLFRNLLVDLTGNTHRAEVSIDKLFDPWSAHGRQGLIELRAFEMPPHPRMAAAQAILMRTVLAALASEPYRRPLARWGTRLHDQFLLPFWLWRDFEAVLDHLAACGLPLHPDAFRPFLELRCPLVGTLHCGEVVVEVRNALEPWPVLGEELTASGTSRYVDSSLERIEVRAMGLVPERHALVVNGRELPLRTTGAAGEAVVGIRFRAWAPPHSLQPHLGIHHPLRLEVLDTWSRRSLGSCSYHVMHPEGRGNNTPPLTHFEASARRARRFTLDGPRPWPVVAPALGVSPDAPYSIDLRRFDMDRAPPAPRADG